MMKTMTYKVRERDLVEFKHGIPLFSKSWEVVGVNNPYQGIKHARLEDAQNELRELKLERIFKEMDELGLG